MILGEVVLITDAGEEVRRAGDCVTFPKNTSNGHHLVNKSDTTAVCLEIGTRVAGDCGVYSDIDMVFDPKLGEYAHKDGTPYPAKG